MKVAMCRNISGLLLGTMLTGCAPWPHFVTIVPEVRGQVVQSGKAISNATIHTQAGVSGTPCEASTLVTKTKEDGSFTIASQSQFRLFVVPLVDPLTVNEWELCIEHQGHVLLGLMSSNLQARTESVIVSCDMDQRVPQEGLIRRADIDGMCQVIMVGNIAGTKLSIPSHLSTGVHYKGEKVSDPWHAPPPRSFESEIQDFSLFLSLPPLQPGMNGQAWANSIEHGPRERFRRGNRWFSSSFSPDRYTAAGGQLQAVVDRYMKDDAQGGPFILQDGDVYGLKQAVPKQQGKEQTSDTQPAELLYDPTTWSTVITCSKNRWNTLPPLALYSNCVHLVVVPELKAVATIYYEKEDLPHWREIENLFKQIAHSFVVH